MFFKLHSNFFSTPSVSVPRFLFRSLTHADLPNNWLEKWKLEAEGKGTWCGCTGADAQGAVLCLHFVGKRNKAQRERLRRHMREKKKGSEHLWNCYHNSFLAYEFYFWGGGCSFLCLTTYNGLEFADHWEFSFKKLIIEFGGKWDNFVFRGILIVMNWKVLTIENFL